MVMVVMGHHERSEGPTSRQDVVRKMLGSVGRGMVVGCRRACTWEGGV